MNSSSLSLHPQPSFGELIISSSRQRSNSSQGIFKSNKQPASCAIRCRKQWSMLSSFTGRAHFSRVLTMQKRTWNSLQIISEIKLNSFLWLNNRYCKSIPSYMGHLATHPLGSSSVAFDSREVIPNEFNRKKP